MTGPLSDQQLDEIRRRDVLKGRGESGTTMTQAQTDRRVLLAEVERLRGDLTEMTRCRDNAIRAAQSAPSRSAITRRLKAAGHRQWAGKTADERKVPGFRVALNRQITPGGVAVIHMAEFDDAPATEAALLRYAETLRAAGYSAQVRVLVGSLRGVAVTRPGDGSAA